MSTLDMFPDLPRRLTHAEIIAGFAELLRAGWARPMTARKSPRCPVTWSAGLSC
ncbi:hypothetical protein LBMAG57_34110 [Verrucomicrobiota bacterium]|nr:hypothetical protein LBMAG57_34110 [Verrucomicrobiota bacterium]